MKLGLHVPSTAWGGGAGRLGATLVEIVEAAEAAGFETIDVADHLWQHPIMGGPEVSQIEAYTTLGFIAARTRRVRLLALATAVSYRHPGLLAKMVTTLDVLSSGRAMLGIGAGDYPEEAHGLGLPFPTLRERFDLVEETVQACLRMWEGEQGDETPFRGAHVRLERPLNLPQSLSRPHPPILIAGTGERRTLPLVARYADACNLRPSPGIPRQLELLRRLCEQEGRDYETIEKTVPFGFDVGADGSKVGEVLGQLRWLAGMGIESVFGWVVGVDQITPLEIMGREVIPAAADLAAGSDPRAGRTAHEKEQQMNEQQKVDHRHTDTPQAVSDLGQRWAAAERAGDVAALDALLDPEFVGVGPRGFVLTREQWLERYQSGALRNQSFTWEDVQMRDFGDTAASVGVQVQQATYQGHDSSGRFRGTQVAVRKGGRWLVAGVHLSPLAEPPARR